LTIFYRNLCVTIISILDKILNKILDKILNKILDKILNKILDKIGFKFIQGNLDKDWVRIIYGRSKICRIF